MNSLKRSDPPKSEGFVLPYVLLVITILAIVGTIAAARLMETSSLLRSIESSAEAEMAFVSAEAQVTFALLTSLSAEGGFALNPDPNIEFVDFLDEVPVNDVGGDLWVIHETRIAPTEFGRVYVRLEDTTGLMPINTAQAYDLIPFLIGFGLAKTRAARLSATLEDYRDFDHLRRFQGGERADYKLRGLPAPGNDILRDYAELNSVLGWAEALQDIDVVKFKQLTTLSTVRSDVNFNFAPEVLSTLLKARKKAQQEGEINDILEDAGLTPSRRTRLTFTYVSSADVLWERVIEIERLNGGPNKPFKRYLVFERSVPQSSAQIIRSDELKNVINATSNQLE